MPPTNKNLTTAVENYFADLQRIRASGGSTPELSYYPPADQPAQRRRQHAQTQGLLHQRDGATGRRPSRLRPLLGKSNTKRKTASRANSPKAV